jgi:hypothetical protein
MAAAATGLSGQANELVHVVAAFKLNAGEPSLSTRTAAPAKNTKSMPLRSPSLRVATPAPAKPSKPAPQLLSLKAAPPPKAKATPPGGDDDWETF